MDRALDVLERSFGFSRSGRFEISIFISDGSRMSETAGYQALAWTGRRCHLFFEFCFDDVDWDDVISASDLFNHCSCYLKISLKKRKETIAIHICHSRFLRQRDARQKSFVIVVKLMSVKLTTTYSYTVRKHTSRPT